MRLPPFLALIALAAPAAASPPPPPPEFVAKAARVLIVDVDAAAIDRWAALFADDVIASVNGVMLARGKPDWVALARSQVGKLHRRVDGYTLASIPSEGNSGELLVIDEVDPVPPAVPNMIADPRWSTRATLYGFGPDHLIHSVRILEAKGFLQIPARQ
jgi:hypothetical protein